MKLLTIQEWLRAIKMFLVSTPLELSSFIVTPIALLFCKKEDEHLPKWLSWYDEPNWGINGDYGWKKDHFPEPENRTWWARTRWLWRNRINGFQITKQGYPVLKTDVSTFKVEGDPNATSVKGKYNTYCLIRTKNLDGKEFFSLYYEKRWCKLFYLRMYIGWKLMDISNCKYFDDIKQWAKSRETEGKSTTLESVFSINPFKR